MKSKVCVVLAGLMLAGVVCVADKPIRQAQDKPNVVFILADDLGLGDVSHYVRTFQKKEPLTDTPNIDALAQQGLWFTDGHSATALCAPTRYCVMSGNNNYRSYAPGGVWSTFAPTAFKEGEVTLGTLMRDAGYSTGFIGKWHLGGDFYVPGTSEIYRGPKSGDILDQVDVSKWIDGGPKYCGFDYDFTTPCGVQGPMYLAYENQVWYPLGEDSKLVFFNQDNATNPKDVTDKGPGPGDSNWDTREIGKMLSSKAVNFIEENAKKTEPFFLYYCSPMVHLPHCPTDEFDGRKIAGSTPTAHLDLTADLDMQVKRIMDALKASGELENTLIIFSSDNGGLRDGAAEKLGYQPGGEWNGSKNCATEGGHRVPTFVVWPGKVKPGVTGELASNQDFVATLAAMLGTTIPNGQALDSHNLLPVLTGKGKFVRREFFANQAGSKQELMYRKMPWKLIVQSNFKRTKYEIHSLYNLQDDPGETKDLAKNPEYRQIAEKMLKEYTEIFTSGAPTAPGRKK